MPGTVGQLTVIGARLARRRVLTFIVLTGLAVNELRVSVGGAGKFILVHPGFSDFASYYVYARVGLHQGWNHLYDLAAQQQEWLRLGGPDMIPWFAMLYPPPLAWLVTPFALLPLPAALGCWTALLIGLSLLAWRLVAPRDPRLARWTALAAMLAVFPIVYGIMLGQVVIVELAALAVVWWLLSRGRELPAGMVLVAMVFKPHLAILVPIVLLLIGRWRTVLVAGLGFALVAALSIVTTGLAGLRDYLARLADPVMVAQQFGANQFTISGVLGQGVVTLVASGLVIALTMAIAWRYRHRGIATPLSCALIGSMVIAPYLHWQDLGMLLLAGGIALHGVLDRWSGGILLLGYAVLLGSFYWGPALLGPLLPVAGVAFLLSVAVRSFSRNQPQVGEMPEQTRLAPAA